MKKHAVILAGGMGTRLKPYTTVLPKPLMPLGKYTVLEVVVRQLAAEGFDQITMAVNHQADLIRAFFGEGERWGLKIKYSLETTPLGTMGPLHLISDLPEHFLVMNGDILSDIKYSQLLETHGASKELFTIACSRRTSKIDYGVLKINSDGKLCGFQEKPTFDFDVSMGVYAVSKNILDHIPKNTSFGFDQLMLKLIEKGSPYLPKIHIHSSYWLDIGRPEDYEKALDEFGKYEHLFIKT